MALLLAILAYFLIGFAFAVPFVAVGCKRHDPVAAATRWPVRAVWLPGAAALWPLLLVRWMKGGPQ